MTSANIEPFFHEDSCTVSYVISDPAGNAAAILDPALDFEVQSGRTATDHADRIICFVRDKGLQVEWILETHAHADHLSAAPYLKSKLGGLIAIGAGIQSVQKAFKPVFNMEPEFATDGSQFDHLFEDGERFRVGELTCEIIATPGHTSDSVTYLFEDAAFIGDTLFMPDFGSARTDFPGGDAKALYESVQRLYSLPPETKLYMCHDYMPGGREPMWETTVADQMSRNVHISSDVSLEKFVKQRTNRDAFLPVPKLMLPAVQVNIRAGELPPPETNGIVYLKLPLNVVGPKSTPEK